LERYSFWVAVNLLQWALFFLAGAAIGWFSTHRHEEALWGGASMLVWGVFVRTVLVWHITWAVNSVTHLWGYRRYETDESSRNNWLIGLLSNGEGWHNNHHAHPSSARHGLFWYELDINWYGIRMLKLLGLAKAVRIAEFPKPKSEARDDGMVFYGDTLNYPKRR
jgi:stearoyl-CoA desaturase (delta-9 desaturase)